MTVTFRQALLRSMGYRCPTCKQGILDARTFASGDLRLFCPLCESSFGQEPE